MTAIAPSTRTVREQRRNLDLGLGLAALALYTFGVLSGCLQNGTLNWDDAIFLEPGNAVLRFDVAQMARQVVLANYHPITLLSLAIDQRLFGLDPFSFHLTNLLLHVANTLLVVLFVRRVATGGLTVPFLCGILFAVHPLHVESVAWIAERKDVLSTAFFLLTLLAWLRFRDRGGAVAYAVTLFAFALALLSKPMTITAPVVFLALDYRFGRRPDLRRVGLHAPFFALAIAAGLANVISQTPPDTSHFAVYGGGVLARLGIGLQSLVFYVSKTVVPHGLSGYYDAERVAVAPWQMLVAAGAGVAAGALLKLRPDLRREALFGLLFFFITVAPVLKVIPFGGHSLFNDRYMYLPSIGLFLVAALPFRDVLRWAAIPRAATLTAGAALLLAFSIQSAQRVTVWRDSGTFWRDVLAVVPGTPVAHNNLGRYYLDERRDLDRAEAEFEAAARARPEFATPYFNLGVIHQQRGHFAMAARNYERFVELDPSDVKGRISIGAFYISNDDLDRAVSHLEAANAAAGGSALALYNLGVAHYQAGRLDDAERAHREAVAIRPDLAESWASLGDIHRKRGQHEEALVFYEKAVELGYDLGPKRLERMRRRAAPPDPRPNVVLISIDTLRADHLGSYGFGLDTSPRIDTLARDGVVFERAIAAASATAPSHASILTSLYPREHSIGHHNGATRLEGTATLAQVFRDAGFATAAFVGNLLLQRRTGFDTGFDVYDDELHAGERNRESILERGAEATTQRALDWLAAQGTHPFFLWVHYQDPHGPYEAPADWAGRFRVVGEPDEKPLPILSNDLGWGGIPAYQVIEGLDRLSQYRSRYADEVHYADHWIGELIAAVDAQARDAIVLLTSDHGEAFGENDRYLVHFYTSTPENAHVPLILRAPGLPPGRRPGIASHVDVMPTLLELAGLDAPPGLRGIALGPLVRGDRPLPDRTVYCDTGRELSAYERGGFLRVLGGGRGGPRPVVTRYEWSEDGAWTRSPQPARLSPSLREHLKKRPPTVTAPAMPSRLARQLRALGYAE